MCLVHSVYFINVCLKKRWYVKKNYPIIFFKYLTFKIHIIKVLVLDGCYNVQIAIQIDM